MTQREFLTNLCESHKDAIIVGSIGSICYDLTEIPHENKILIRGAMGAALGCGLGMAMHTKKEVVVIIGDGSYLMKMGCMSTILKHNLLNLKVYIINNNSYKSCGGQKTNFNSVGQYCPFDTWNDESDS